MEKLNELVDLAKNATQGEWTTDIRGSVINADDQANNGFVICDASGCDKSNNAKFIAAANPKTILAIAEAFRALEQRAEKAEAKLAELEKQKSVALLDIQRGRSDGNKFALTYTGSGHALADDVYELFTRPAPAADQVPEGWRLVPVTPDWGMLSAAGCKEHHNGQSCLHHDNRRRIWAAMLAAAPNASILRNIEEEK